MEQETNEQCLLMQEDYLQFVQQIGSREAITRRFFLIFEYEPMELTPSALMKKARQSIALQKCSPYCYQLPPSVR